MINLRLFTRTTTLALLVGAGLTLNARGQPAAPASPDTIALTAGGSYSAASSLEHGSQALGETSVTVFQLGLRTSAALGNGYRFGYGLDYGRSSLDADAGVPLPDALEEMALPLSLTGPLAPGWIGRLQLRPGLFGTSLELAGRQVNVPVLALASYRVSNELTWSLGLRYDAWSRYQLLPLAGVNWTFAPRWELAVGFPRTGVLWRFHPDHTLLLGASFQGGSYRVDSVPAAVAASSSSPSAKLDYREIRVGAALDLFSRGARSLVLDAGVIVSQRFDYRQPSYRLDGDPAGYVAVSGRLRF